MKIYQKVNIEIFPFLKSENYWNKIKVNLK